MGVGLFALGGVICLVNAYLSWLRFPLHRWRGGTAESFRWVSGVPLLGSGLVVASLFVWQRAEESLLVRLAAAALIALDPGGPHWFALSVWRGRGR